MTAKEFKRWRKNGNFTLSQERILSITNDIAEGIHGTYTKREAAECVQYWSLEASSKVSSAHLTAMDKILRELRRTTAKVTVKP